VAEQEPFKNAFNPTSIAALGQLLARADPRIDVEAFVAEGCEGLTDLELKDRVRHLATVVSHHVVPDFPRAVSALLAALPPRTPADGSDPIDFVLWPLCHWVQTCGLDHFEASMEALEALTPRFSAEFAIRPFLDREPERTLAVLHRWAASPDPHVRRLVSEGSRPRLPWGARLPRFQRNPSETLALLERLRLDDQRYVQRSVANHLNDISKDHPEVAVEVAGRWMEDGRGDLPWIVRHALRGLVKAGHPGALAVLGFGPPQLTIEHFTVSPSEFEVGGTLIIETTLRSGSDHPQSLVIDYPIHFVKANGKRSPKVFKGSNRTLKPNEMITIKRRIALRPVSTRRYYVGEHKVEIKINGVTLGERAFDLRIPPPGQP